MTTESNDSQEAAAPAVLIPASAMTLRDHFAGHALQAMLTRGMESFFLKGEQVDHDGMLAKCAYVIADAMLAARSQS